MSKKADRKAAVKAALQVDFEQVIHNFAGIPLKIDNETVTLKFLAVTALLSHYPDEPQLTGEMKALRYQLAKRIHLGDKEINPLERDTVRTLIGKNFIPILVGPAFDMLDGKTAPPAPTEEVPGELAS